MLVLAKLWRCFELSCEITVQNCFKFYNWLYFLSLRSSFWLISHSHDAPFQPPTRFDLQVEPYMHKLSWWRTSCSFLVILARLWYSLPIFFYATHAWFQYPGVECQSYPVWGTLFSVTPFPLGYNLPWVLFSMYTWVCAHAWPIFSLFEGDFSSE